MRIALLQLDGALAAPVDERRRAVADLVRAQAGADLVLLPELWPQGGFAYRDWAELAEAVDGPTYQAISAAARDIGGYVHAGSVIERADDGALYNTSLLLDPAGTLLATYRKIHLFGFSEGEPVLLTPGTDVVVVDTPLGRLGLATCYDLRFPELFRALLDAGAETVLVPAAWPAARVAHWSLLARARAVEDQVLLVACNTGGSQRGLAFGGASVVVDPWGTVHGEAGDGAQVLVVDVDTAVVADARSRFPVLADRRL